MDVLPQELNLYKEAIQDMAKSSVRKDIQDIINVFELISLYNKIIFFNTDNTKKIRRKANKVSLIPSPSSKDKGAALPGWKVLSFGEDLGEAKNSVASVFKLYFL